MYRIGSSWIVNRILRCWLHTHRVWPPSSSSSSIFLLLGWPPRWLLLGDAVGWERIKSNRYTINNCHSSRSQLMISKVFSLTRDATSYEVENWFATTGDLETMVYEKWRVYERQGIRKRKVYISPLVDNVKIPLAIRSSEVTIRLRYPCEIVIKDTFW